MERVMSYITGWLLDPTPQDTLIRPASCCVRNGVCRRNRAKSENRNQLEEIAGDLGVLTPLSRRRRDNRVFDAAPAN